MIMMIKIIIIIMMMIIIMIIIQVYSFTITTDQALAIISKAENAITLFYSKKTADYAKFVRLHVGSLGAGFCPVVSDKI